MIILSIFIYSKKEDFFCLNNDEFGAFRYVYYEQLSEEDRKRTYLFNSFFYTRLTRKGTDDIPNIS